MERNIWILLLPSCVFHLHCEQVFYRLSFPMPNSGIRIYIRASASLRHFCVSFKSAAKQRLELLTLWSLFTTYLNILFDPHVLISKIKCGSFPLLEILTYQNTFLVFLISRK